MPLQFGRVVVIGVGLIGGSFAKALRAACPVREIIGIGRSRANLEQAVALGVIDGFTEDAAAVRGADLVLLAMPVAQTADVLARIAPALEPGTVVTDAGSTKQDVIAAARGALGARLRQFVPAHPIAGAEESGVGAARAELFRSRKVVLTPIDATDPASVARVESAWKACGAELRSMRPDEHDAVFAAVSHLPHLLAYALVHDVARHANAEVLFDYAASGFRDFTRIASSHPEMWRDICIANRAALGGELARYRAVLDRVQALLEQADGAALESLFKEARVARDRWIGQTREGSV